MGIEDLGLLLENIEEYVMEQKKVVTYKWLSRTFSLNVNQAKQLLAIFHMKHKNMKHKSIQGVYYVSGMRTNSSGQLTHQVCIVTEDLLDATTAQLNPITSVHLYSVQKGKPKDTAPIYNVDFEQIKKKVYETTEFSMVQCPEAVISQVINNALRPVTPPALKNKVKVMSSKTKVETKCSVVKNSSSKKSTSAAKTAPPKKTTAVKKQDLSNFFTKGKAEAKKTEQKKPEPKISSPMKRKKTDAPLKTKPKTDPKPKAVIVTKSKPEPKIKAEIRGPLAVSDSILVKDVEDTKTKVATKSGTKRKRVRRFSEEEEEELQEEMQDVKLEEEEVVCLMQDEDIASPTENKKPGARDVSVEECRDSPESKKPRVRRKRVRKLVSKTTINEEGFMETEKVYEEHSCTDEEEAVVEVAMPVPVSNNNKQSSLMGFFKKS